MNFDGGLVLPILIGLVMLIIFVFIIYGIYTSINKPVVKNS